MTTTAEKIKIMQAFDEWKKRGFDQPAIIEKCEVVKKNWEDVGYEPLWNWDLFEYRIKPADPEPLECWGNYYQDGIASFWPTENEADNYASNRRLRKVHMREIRPQDEQDRKDAARYLWLKKADVFSSKNLGGYWIIPGTPLRRLYVSDVTAWDQMIDEAMGK